MKLTSEAGVDRSLLFVVDAHDAERAQCDVDEVVRPAAERGGGPGRAGRLEHEVCTKVTAA